MLRLVPLYRRGSPVYSQSSAPRDCIRSVQGVSSVLVVDVMDQSIEIGTLIDALNLLVEWGLHDLGRCATKDLDDGQLEEFLARQGCPMVVELLDVALEQHAFRAKLFAEGALVSPVVPLSKELDVRFEGGPQAGRFVQEEGDGDGILHAARSLRFLENGGEGLELVVAHALEVEKVLVVEDPFVHL